MCDDMVEGWGLSASGNFFLVGEVGWGFFGFFVLLGTNTLPVFRVC